MRAVSPIRDSKHIELLKMYFKSRNLRDYVFFMMGINTNLRVSDLLSLKIEDVYTGKKIKEYIEIREQKTGKTKKIRINENIEKALIEYIKKEELQLDDYIFKSKKGDNNPISRQQAHYILQQAGEYCNIEEPISPHSLRKTWGYWAWKRGVSLALIMEGFSHSSISITKRYLGIIQEDLDDVFINLNL